MSGPRGACIPNLLGPVGTIRNAQGDQSHEELLSGVRVLGQRSDLLDVGALFE